MQLVLLEYVGIVRIIDIDLYHSWRIALRYEEVRRIKLIEVKR